MLNRIIVMGRLTRDPELRRTQTGVSVTSFTVAVDRDFKSQNGERETDFIDVVAWRSTAEFVTKYFSKGRMAIVEGQLQIRDWTDREGQKRRNAEIVADRVRFGESRRDNDEYNGPSYGSGGSSYGAPAASSYGSGGASYGGTAPASAPGYGGGSASGFGTGGAPGYGAAPGYGGGSASSGFSGGNAPGYGSAPSFDSNTPAGYSGGQSDFAELGEEEDGDLPF